MGINLYKNIFFVFIILLVNNLNSNGETKVNYSSKSEIEFNKGLSRFASHRYEESKNIFQQLANDKVKHQRTSSSMLMFARSLTLTKQFQQSNEVLSLLFQQFPNIKYRSDILETMGVNYYRLNNYSKSILFFVDLLNKNESSVFNKVIARSFIKEIIIFQAEQSSIPKLVNEFENLNETFGYSYLLLQVAERYYRDGDDSNARSKILSLLKNTEDQLLISQSDALLQHINKKHFVEIGVILPLFEQLDSSFTQKKIAKEIRDGLEKGVAFHNQQSRTQIKLIYNDMSNNIKLAANQLHELSQNNYCIGIIGPLFSYDAQILSALAKRRKIPLITPTATDTGISSKGDYIFQLNYDYNSRGKSLAKFALQHLQKKNIAVISPSSYPYRYTTDIFVKEIINGGGLIVSDIRYPKGATDLRSSFRMIRTDGILIESDTSYMKKKRNYYVDSLQFPINSIDLIYMPITDKQQVSIMASHLKLFNISTTVLGSNEWMSKDELELNRNNYKNIYFPSDNLTSTSEINSNFAFGFDTISMLSMLVDQGARSRDVLENELSNLLSSEGVRGKYSLHPTQSNSSISIFEYQNGKVKQVDEVNTYE